MDRAFHARVREGFLAIARAAPERCVVVEAGGSPEAVAAALLGHVTARLGPMAT
jgi:dTMP kinase